MISIDSWLLCINLYIGNIIYIRYQRENTIFLAAMEFQTLSDSIPPALYAESDQQKASLAELNRVKKYSKYEHVTLENKDNYHKVSCRPITKLAEDDMELLSDIVTWGEMYLHHFDVGVYHCSRCNNALYSSIDKYRGPCVWPSFRKPISSGAISTTQVFPYNKYNVVVKEVYCGKCDLFIGHQFEDAKEKGDTHPLAHWRH